MNSTGFINVEVGIVNTAVERLALNLYWDVLTVRVYAVESRQLPEARWYRQ